MSEAMELTEKEFDQIGSYVREHLGRWIRDISPPTAIVQLDPVYLERIVRVEEELKSQRELMKQGFEQVDKRFEEMRADTNARFEQVDKRFEQVDKRFEETRADMNTRFREMRADMNTRFETVNDRFDEAHRHTNHWMTVISVILGLMTVAVTVTNLM